MRPLPLAATLLVLAACPPPEPVDQSQDPIVDTTPAPVTLTGTYRVTSQFEVPATVLAPGTLGESLELVHQLSDDPAGVIIDFAAGGTAMELLRGVLPDTLEPQLEGWMNGYLDSATVNGTLVHAELDEVDALIQSVLLDWELRSTLDLTAEGTGTHAPIALVFSAGGQPIVVPVDATAPVTAGTGVKATVSWTAGVSEPRVAISEHFMGVPFGHYALTAFETALASRYGTPDFGGTLAIRGALGKVIDCAGMAASVADRCVGAGILELCVGNEARLTDVCEDGLDAAAAQLEAKILSIDYKAIHFISGGSTVEGVVREAATATATALSGGEWSSIIDLKQVPKEATASFTAVPFTPGSSGRFDHWGNEALALLGPSHSMQDVIVAPGSPIVLRGKFGYGIVSTDLQDEKVGVHLHDGSVWRRIGQATTDAGGRIAFTVPEALPVGVYDVRLEVLGDATLAPGRIWILPVGTHLAISDIDGTLTTSDEELLQDVLADLYAPILGGDFVPSAWPGGADLTHALADRGRVVVYLTGRPYWLTAKTRGWLSSGAFAPGALHTTDSNAEALPAEAGVGAFKLAFLQGLAAQGFLLDEAYGNASTDVFAYAGAGVPAEQTWIIGPNGGDGGTNAVENSWAARAAEILAAPAVVQP